MVIKMRKKKNVYFWSCFQGPCSWFQCLWGETCWAPTLCHCQVELLTLAAHPESEPREMSIFLHHPMPRPATFGSFLKAASVCRLVFVTWSSWRAEQGWSWCSWDSIVSLAPLALAPPCNQPRRSCINSGVLDVTRSHQAVLWPSEVSPRGWRGSGVVGRALPLQRALPGLCCSGVVDWQLHLFPVCVKWVCFLTACHGIKKSNAT